jgi:gentisate 1,2-dioxygenase
MAPSGPIEALDAFMRTFRFPAEQGLIVKNLPDHEVMWRADRSNSAAYFSFDGLHSLEAHVSEIAAGQDTQSHRHSCEAIVYVLAGSGYTLLWSQGEPERRIDWHAGDLFLTPVQVWHRHCNTDQYLPARYLEITTIPLMKSLGAWSIEVAQPEASRSSSGSSPV